VRLTACAILAAVIGAVVLSPLAVAQPLKVFVLVGQSNMQGQGAIEHLSELAAENPTEYGHLKKNGRWIERDDVWIKYWDKKGKLTVGYGSPKDRIGPELGFGHVMGGALDSQVLIIKVAWGGQSLALDFRPPSSGQPTFTPDKKTQERIDSGEYEIGIRFRETVDEVKTTLANLQRYFPDYEGQGYDIAGLVWFQGFNDVINDDYRSEYGTNLVNFIRDVRMALGMPQLPIVVGELGMDGVQVNPRYAHKHYAMRNAQKAPSVMAEFKGTVGFAGTSPYVVKEGKGYDGGYHYRGRADTFYKIGVSFGQVMCELLEQEDSERRVFQKPEDHRSDPAIRNIEGWTVHVDPQMLQGEHGELGAEALKMLANHLQRIAILVPKQQLTQMQNQEIWIEHHHPTLSAMQYHPSVDWLKRHGHDPRLARKVHIPRAQILLSRQQMIKHPAMVLHELAHAYHDQYLGFDEQRVVAAYRKAKEAGTYDNVLLYTGRKDRHYALTDHKEYFAEGTESYFYRNDFYPFVRAELKEHDPTLHDLLADIWGPLQ
jgi:Carbohydrate esterase, sialic acid-specific acetylesterase